MRKFWPVFVAVIVFVLAGTGVAVCSDDEDLTEQVGNGKINWSKGLVYSTGIGAPPANLYGKPAARPMALRAAKMDAMRNLLEVVKGVRIDSSTTVRDFAVESDVIRTNVEGMIRGAEEVKKEYMSDGTVEVTMKMSINGGFAQLVLPEEIKPIEPIQAMTPSEKAGHASGYTGLVIDARGLDARPAMAPKVVSEDHEEVYGSAFVSREFAVQQGMAGYARDLADAQHNPRVGDNPLTVKGLRTDGQGKSNIVISNADASKIRTAADHLSFLRQCRVMIVLD